MLSRPISEKTLYGMGEVLGVIVPSKRGQSSSKVHHDSQETHGEKHKGDAGISHEHGS
jgi:hypothetical protein